MTSDSATCDSATDQPYAHTVYKNKQRTPLTIHVLESNALTLHYTPLSSQQCLQSLKGHAAKCSFALHASFLIHSWCWHYQDIAIIWASVFENCTSYAPLALLLLSYLMHMHYGIRMLGCRATCGCHTVHTHFLAKSSPACIF